MLPTLYMFYPSPAVRAVLITAKAIGLALNKKEINLFKSEQLNPEYLKLNPQHTVPALVEPDGFTVWDSHSIITYLVSKYAKSDSLYPKNLKKRATIDQRLFFEASVVFPHLKKITVSVLYQGKANTIDEQDKDVAHECYQFLESFLDGKEWIAGNNLSVADYSLISSVSSLKILVPIDSEKYPKVTSWFNKCEKLPEYEANKRGLEETFLLFKNKLPEI